MVVVMAGVRAMVVEAKHEAKAMAVERAAVVEATASLVVE